MKADLLHRRGALLVVLSQWIWVAIGQSETGFTVQFDKNNFDSLLYKPSAEPRDPVWTNPALVSLMKWAKENGAVISHVEEGYFKRENNGGHRIVRGLGNGGAEISKDEVIMKIPKNLIYAEDKLPKSATRFKHMSNQPAEKLGYFLAEEKRKGTDSFWKPWIDALPKLEEFKTHHLVFMDNNTRRHFYGHGMVSVVENDWEVTQDLYEEYKIGCQNDGQTPVALEDAMWGKVVVNSRAATPTLSGELIHGVLPVADLANDNGRNSNIAWKDGGDNMIHFYATKKIRHGKEIQLPYGHFENDFVTERLYGFDRGFKVTDEWVGRLGTWNCPHLEIEADRVFSDKWATLIDRKMAKLVDISCKKTNPPREGVPMEVPPAGYKPAEIPAPAVPTGDLEEQRKKQHQRAIRHGNQEGAMQSIQFKDQADDPDDSTTTAAPGDTAVTTAATTTTAGYATTLASTTVAATAAPVTTQAAAATTVAATTVAATTVAGTTAARIVQSLAPKPDGFNFELKRLPADHKFSGIEEVLEKAVRTNDNLRAEVQTWPQEKIATACSLLSNVCFYARRMRCTAEFPDAKIYGCRIYCWLRCDAYNYWKYTGWDILYSICILTAVAFLINQLEIGNLYTEFGASSKKDDTFRSGDMGGGFAVDGRNTMNQRQRFVPQSSHIH